MADLDRRAFLIRSGALALTAPAAFPAFSAQARRSHGEPGSGDWRDLVEPFRKDSLEEGFARLARELRAGRKRDELLSAILLAGVRDVRPSPVGFKLHAVMVIESARGLAMASPENEAALPVFFALHDLKVSQMLDEQEGGWELGPPPDKSGIDPAQAATRWREALLAWDYDEAERCASVLGAQPVSLETFEAVWPACMRDFHNVGHKPIYATQLALMAVRWKEPAAEPLLRTLSSGLMEEGDTAAHRDLYEANTERALKMPAGWEAGHRNGAASIALLEALRTASPERAVERGLELLAAKVGPDTIWDGILLHASEILLRAPSLLPVHAFTSTHAFRHIARVSQHESTRALALLQALAWAPLYRERLKSLVRADSQHRRIDDEEAQAVAPTDSDRHALRERLRQALLQQVSEHHQFKYAAALLEEAKLAAPDLAALHLAAAVRYLPPIGGDGGEITRLAKRALSD